MSEPRVNRYKGSTMKRVVLALGMALAAAVPSASATGLARVWVADNQPLVVRGAGFHATSRVTVVVSKLKQTFRSSAMSTATGGFTARFDANLPRRCGTTVVTAVDASAQRALMRIVANDCGGIRMPLP